MKHEKSAKVMLRRCGCAWIKLWGTMLVVEERGKVRCCRSSLLLQYTVVINTEEFEEMMNPTDVVQVDEKRRRGLK